ncbi:uncharacterized protein PV09_07048 [Verruconis gallopava]|uniref:EthD domain-containing protein n=1 Tax=Verruconis gallopava TaxID=253628 RepID=A0A0D2AQX3_9PEZI|nr:uncharacterized protein PV09_07048 [Verruconis gallopava]KIW01574.1 hypothetical protein PV09_07048 [Verruconis gallopava]
MPILVTVLYPQGEFNLDYYLATHMPLVENTWKNKGLLDWKVAKLGPQADGSESPYQIEAILTFESAEKFQAAAAEDGAAIFGDIPNFTPLKATIVAGESIASMK